MLMKNPPVELVRNLWMLGTKEFPVYLLKGQTEGVLFEGGTSATAPVVLAQLEQMGIEKGFIKQLIVTHAHPGHVMGVPFLRKTLPGISVVASRLAAETLSHRKTMTSFSKIDAALTASLTKAGLLGEGHHSEAVNERNIPVDRVVGDGDLISVGSSAYFTVIETPGHSDCSLSFHEPNRRILIISDATGYYIPEQEYWWPSYVADFGSYVGSMERLSEHDARILCLSHNAAVKGTEDLHRYFDAAIEATWKYHQHIIDRVNAGETAEQIAEELAKAVCKKIQLLPRSFFLKSCASMVRQSAKHEGIKVQK